MSEIECFAVFCPVQTATETEKAVICACCLEQAAKDHTERATKP